MKVICKIVEIDDKWDALVKNFNFDIYHLSGWLRSAEIIEDGIAKGIVAELDGKKWLCPVIIKSIDDNYKDLSSAYGYGGPIYDTSFNIKEIDTILKELTIFLKENHYVSWFIRLHPILNRGWDSNVGNIVTHGLTLSSNLIKGSDEHWKETSKGHRYSIKKAIKNNIAISIEKIDKKNIICFSSIYEQAMKAVNASSFYFFKFDYFLSLIENLSERIILVNAILEGKIIASAMYLCCKESGIIQYHLSATLLEYRRFSPTTLINHTVREWGKENGYSLLHLGGGVGASKDSLYEYKKGFCSEEYLFKTHRIVIDEGKYIQLVDKKNISFDNSELDFFPLYRKAF